MRLLIALFLPVFAACGSMGTPGLFAHEMMAGASQSTPRQADAIAHYLTAIMHQRNGRYEEYIEELRKAHDLAPDSTTILSRLGEAYMRRQEYAKAQEAYEKALKNTPNDPVLWVWLGVANQQLDRYDEAAEAFQKAIDLAPENPVGYQALIEALTSANNFVGAVEVYQKLVQIRPESAELHMHLGGSLARIKDTEGARKALEEALEIDPQLDRARFALGFVLLDLDQNAESAEQFRKYLLNNPDDLDAAEGLVGALARMGQYAEALQELRRIIESELAEPVHHLERIYLLTRAGQAGEASALSPPNESPYFGTILRALARKEAGEPYRPLVEALDAAEGDLQSESREFLGEFLSLFGDTEAGGYLVEALGALRAEGIQSKPIDFFLARTLLILKRYPEAEQVLRAAVERHPSDKTLLYELAGAYDQMDRFADTEKYLQRCLELDPDNPEILNFLGYLYADEGVKLDEAQELIEKALDLDPDNPFYLDSLGWVYYRKGDAGRAIELIRRAIFLMDADDAVLRDHLGDAYMLSGNADRAVAEWKRAQRLDPELQGVQEKIERHRPRAKMR
jgi:Flp pilus assembly protein TadD